MMLDAPSLLAISLPITHPEMMGLGHHPLWFGVYVVIFAEIGVITLLVGMNCFVMTGAAGDLVTHEQIFGGIWPFLVACMLMLILMLVVPEVAIYLPRTM